MPDRRIPYLLGLIALAIAGALLTRAKPVGTRSSTLSQPDLFMRGAVREDLTRVANRLFGLSFRTIVTQPESLSRATMLPGAPPTPVPADVDSVLRRHGFTHTGIKPSDSVAIFVSIRGRTAYRYTYSTRPLGPPYTGPSTLSQEDFFQWAELQRIARVGLDTSEYTRARTVFEPTIVYPYLQRVLGDSQLSVIASKRSPAEITPSEKRAVLAALNEQRLSRSRLIEHPGIIYDARDPFGLGLGSRRVTRLFWGVPLLDTLLKAGAIQWAPDHRHLRIQEGLSAANERRVEWLHVGVMTFLYGNLFEKADPGYDLDLGGGWYFRRD